MENKYFLTHVSRQHPEKDRWVVLPFISQREGLQGYLFGTEETRVYSQEIIDEELAGGAIQEVPRTPLLDSQHVWLAPDGKVYLANEDPILDPSKLELATISLS